MIIFQAQASRLFPKVLDQIVDNVGNSVAFHYPFVLKNEQDWLTPNNILQAIPEKSLHIRTNKFLYGVFSSNHLNLRSGDIVFTILNNPIDQVYESFAYVKYVTNEIDKKNEIFGAATCAREYKRNQSQALQQFRDISIQDFVDAVLNDDEFVFEHLGVKYKSIKENILSFDDHRHFTYIGRYDKIDEFFIKISEIFGKEIKPIKDRKYLSYEGEYYKRDLIEQKLKDKLDFFNSLKA
jgi:hypothetical protein